jgi:hypothetical protein
LSSTNGSVIPGKNKNVRDEEKERVAVVLCDYTVFNVEQCDGLTLPVIEKPTSEGEIKTDENCESRGLRVELEFPKRPPNRNSGLNPSGNDSIP